MLRRRAADMPIPGSTALLRGGNCGLSSCGDSRYANAALHMAVTLRPVLWTIYVP